MSQIDQGATHRRPGIPWLPELLVFGLVAVLVVARGLDCLRIWVAADPIQMRRAIRRQHRWKWD